MILSIRSSLAKIAAQKTAAVKLAAAVPVAPKPTANTPPRTEAERAAAKKVAATKREADSLVAEIAAAERAGRERLAAAVRTTADQRKRLAAAKAAVDRLPAGEKAANARLTCWPTAAWPTPRQPSANARHKPCRTCCGLFNTKEFVFNH